MGKADASNVTIVIPTRGRPDRVSTLLDFITHRPLLLAVDEDSSGQDLPADLKGSSVVYCPGTGPASASHFAITTCPTDYVMTLNDDIDWSKASPHFFEHALDKFNMFMGDGYGVVGLNDGHHTEGEIACFALFPKKFYEDHLDWRIYERYAGDTEMTLKAKALGCYKFASEALVPHLYANGTGYNSEPMVRDHDVLNKRMAAFRASHVLGPAKKLMIGLPVYGGVDPHFFRCCMKLVHDHGCNIAILPMCGDSLIPRARNSITAKFLESDCTHLLMIDSDLVFSTDHISRILSHNQPVVGGFYPKKQTSKPEWVINTLDKPQPVTDGGLQPLKYIGSGFTCVRRDVFEKMIEVYGNEIAYQRDDDRKKTEYDFWSVGVYKFPDGSRRYLSEDWYFCQRCLDLGFSVYGDTRIALKHSGNVLFPLPHQEEELVKMARLEAGAGSIPTSAPATAPA